MNPTIVIIGLLAAIICLFAVGLILKKNKWLLLFLLFIPYQALGQSEEYRERLRENFKEADSVFAALPFDLILLRNDIWSPPIEPIYHKKNSIGVTIQPQDLGFGMRYNRLGDRIGGYASFLYVNHKLEFGGYLKDHWKVSAGIAIRALDPDSYLTFGLIKHWYGDIYTEPVSFFNQDVLLPVSFEAGITMRFEIISIGFRMDLVKWGESSLDLQFRFQPNP